MVSAIVRVMYGERIEQAFAAVEAAVALVAELPVELMCGSELLDVQDRQERVRRLLSGTERAALARLNGRGTAEFGGGALGLILADRLRIDPREAGRRIHEAAELADRTSETGQPLPPLLPNTARAERHGLIGAGHVQVIREFLRDLPAAVPLERRAEAEERLAHYATYLRPDQVKECANRLSVQLNPDDAFTEQDRARKRYVNLKAQDVDKMRAGSFRVTPEVAAYLEVIFAKLAAPGMCNPDDAVPTVDGVPDPDAASRDARTPGQRRHDALATICRDALASGRLGSHRGLPVTVIATTTVQELQDYAAAAGAVPRPSAATTCDTGAAAGVPAGSVSTGFATTGGGSLLPIRDLVRMAGRALPYLCVFDDHTGKPLYLGRAKRLASAEQRLALHAADRGCTHPGCPAPGYVCEAHHVDDWANGGATDIGNLTFVCRTHHSIIGVDSRKWRTSKSRGGRTQWIPPHHVDPSGMPRTNSYHRSEEPIAGAGDAQPP